MAPQNGAPGTPQARPAAPWYANPALGLPGFGAVFGDYQGSFGQGHLVKAAEQAATRQDLLKNGKMVGVQVGAPDRLNPQGTWEYRLQGPAGENGQPGAFYNLLPGEDAQLAKRQGLRLYSNQDLQAEKERLYGNADTRDQVTRATAKKERTEAELSALRLEESKRQTKALENQTTLLQSQVEGAKADRIEGARRYGLEAQERKDERTHRDRREAVLDQRYIDEIAQRNKLTEYGFQVAAYNARAQRRGDLFNFIGNALRGLMA